MVGVLLRLCLFFGLVGGLFWFSGGFVCLFYISPPPLSFPFSMRTTLLCSFRLGSFCSSLFWVGDWFVCDFFFLF